MQGSQSINSPYFPEIAVSPDQRVIPSRSTVACLFLFAVGCLIRIDVHLLGRLAVGDLLLIASTPFALGSLSTLNNDWYYRRLSQFLLLWLLGVVISDYVNRSEMELFLRGAAKPILCFLMLLVFVDSAKRDSRSLVYFFFGVAISGIINFIVPTDFRAVEIAENAGDNPGYAYYAYIYTPAAFAVASVGGYVAYRIHPLLSGAFQLIMGGIAIPLISRTSGCVLLLSGIIIVVTYMLPGVRQHFFYGNRIKRGILWRFALSGVLAFCALYYAYAYLASNRIIGERQYQKYLAQSNSTRFGNTPLGIIAGGRHYTVGAILRIIDNPLFGAGSWPRTGDTLIRAAEFSGRDFNFARHDPNQRDIGHSIFFGIWAQNGPLVIPFMLMSYAAVIRAFILLAFSRSPLKALIMIYLITLLFGFFFNNFNSLARLLMVLMPVFCKAFAIRLSGYSHASPFGPAS